MNVSPFPPTLPRRALSGVAASVAAVTVAAALLPGSLRAEPNPQMKEVLDAYATISPIPIEKTVPAIAKLAPSISAAVKIVMTKDGKKAPPFTGSTQDFKIDVGNGENVDARAYIPAGDGPFPTVLYIHGGGWVIGSIDVYDSSPRALCELTKAVVISTDYRLAPKNLFPTAHDDTFTAYKYVLENAAKYKGDPKKVAVVGESAGGDMAASICIEAKEKGIQEPVYQVLVYPVTNYDFTTPSYKSNDATKPLNAEGMKWFFKYYLAQPADGNNPRLSVLQAKDVTGVAPATIIAAEIDPLLSEGQAYAEKLKAAGVPVTYKMYPGVTHEFFGMSAVVDEAKQAEQLAADGLTGAFSK